MKTLMKWLLWGVAVLMVVVVAGGALLPSKAVVRRQTIISAPPETVFGIVSNLKRFNEWSPWAMLDPATRYSFEGPDGAVGQKMSWVSANPEVGSGSQTIVRLNKNRSVVIAVDYGEMGQATTSLELAPVDDRTAVSWVFRSDLNGIIGRWIGLMFDSGVGDDFRRGLSRLKDLAEKEAPSIAPAQ